MTKAMLEPSAATGAVILPQPADPVPQTLGDRWRPVLAALTALTGTAAGLVLRPDLAGAVMVAAGGPASDRFTAGARPPPDLLLDPHGRLADLLAPVPAPVVAFSTGAASYGPGYFVVAAETLCWPDGERFATLVLLDVEDGSTSLDATAIGLVAALHADLAAERRLAEARAEHEQLAAALDEARAETALARRESLAKSNFLATMSHELRTPLNAIIGFSEIMKEQLFGKLGNAAYVDYATDIHGCGCHLLSLINDILDIAKIAGHRMAIRTTWLDLDETLATVVRMVTMMAFKRGIEIAVACEPAGLKVLADERALKQILFNLLSNAIKYSHPDGRVVVSGRRDAAGRVAISVADRGAGMDAVQVARVFRPFERADNRFDETHQGIGLGLALVNSLMVLHGGWVTIDSAVGRGTTATAVFPCDDAAVETIDEDAAPLLSPA